MKTFIGLRRRREHVPAESTLADDLPRLVREVHAGRQTLPLAVQATLQERAAHPTLTSREIEVMKLVAAGRRDKEIAIALAISNQTVRVHMKNIFTTLDVSDRTEDERRHPPRDYSDRAKRAGLAPFPRRRRASPSPPCRVTRSGGTTPPSPSPTQFVTNQRL